jgi:hypothetical protein
MPISARLRPAATALLGLALACGHPSGSPSPSGGSGAALRLLPRSQLYVLEMAGIPPDDTLVTFPVGQRRVIVLRHGAPDNTVFAEVTFPDSVFRSPGAPDSVTVVLRPRPGLYALDLASTVLPLPGSTIRFNYPVHFAPPLAAVQRYGSAVRYERALAVAVRTADGRYQLLASERPASDNLQAPLPGPGTYLVAAPR